MNQRKIIFDIDGTLADCKHRLHHILEGEKDWDAFDAEAHMDKPIFNIIKILWAMGVNPFIEVIILTGRNERTRQATLEWLANHDIHFDRIMMRPLNDRRPAAQTKEALLKKFKVDPEDVMTIFEDDPNTVKHLRKLGYHVSDVGGWENSYVEASYGGR